MQITNLEKTLCLTSERRIEIKRNRQKQKTCLKKLNLLVNKGKNCSFVSHAISDELQSKSYSPVNIAKALITTNRILKMIAAALSFLTCKPMRAIIVYSNMSKETSFPYIPTRK